MQIKFILTADGVEHELGPDCVKNWDDIKCTWKRKDFSGIVRSFTSKFEFVNAAYDILLDQFQRFETEAQVTIGMWVINNHWGWDKVFECPLDFSTYHEQKGCIKLSATDNSIAALIKANKSTKYEYVVGEDIVTDKSFMYDRIPMQESTKYAFTLGESLDDGSLRVNRSFNTTIYGDELNGETFMGNVGSEILIGRHIYFTDDQTDTQEYMIKAEKDVSVRMRSNFEGRFY